VALGKKLLLARRELSCSGLRNLQTLIRVPHPFAVFCERVGLALGAYSSHADRAAGSPNLGFNLVCITTSRSTLESGSSCWLASSRWLRSTY